MKAIELMLLIGEAKPEYILEAEEPMAVRSSRKKLFLLAAVIAAALILAGCALVYVLKMQNLQVDEQVSTVPVIDEDTGLSAGTAPVTQPVLTLAGLEGSPSHQAAKEWYDFKRAYDPDHLKQVTLAQENKIPEFPSQYAAYNIYTQEMKDKLDEIVQKYDLKYMGSSVYFRTTKLLCKAVGMETPLVSGSDANARMESATYYDSGNMDLSFNIQLPGQDGGNDVDTWSNLYYRRKDVFAEDVCIIGDGALIGNPDGLKEWSYQTSSGANVLIVRSPADWRAWIFCDRTDAMISMMVNARFEVYSDDEAGNPIVNSTEMTDRELERLADAMDFSMKPELAENYDEIDIVQEESPASQDGYTITVKSAVTDGQIAYITLGVTAPENAVTFDWKKEPYRLSAGNAYGDLLVPTDGESGRLSCLWETQDDGDGLDNTWNFVIRVKSETTPVFLSESKWNLYFEGILDTRFDTDTMELQEAFLTEAAWSFDIAFDRAAIQEVELIQEPISVSVCVSYREDGVKTYQEMQITSILLRPFSATISYDGAPQAGANSFLNEEKGYSMEVFMKDGSKISMEAGNPMKQGKHTLTAERPIDLDEVDHVLLFDGSTLKP